MLSTADVVLSPSSSSTPKAQATHKTATQTPLGGPNRETCIRVSKQMTRIWVSFANFGDPNKNLRGKITITILISAPRNILKAY